MTSCQQVMSFPGDAFFSVARSPSPGSCLSSSKLGTANARPALVMSTEASLLMSTIWSAAWWILFAADAIVPSKSPISDNARFLPCKVVNTNVLGFCTATCFCPQSVSINKFGSLSAICHNCSACVALTAKS